MDDFVDEYILGRSDRPGDHVGQWMAVRVLGRDQALVDQFLYVAVIAGELLKLAVP